MILQEGTKTALIRERGESSYRVVLLDSYFETEKEYFFDTLKEAETFAKFWLTSD